MANQIHIESIRQIIKERKRWLESFHVIAGCDEDRFGSQGALRELEQLGRWLTAIERDQAEHEAAGNENRLTGG